MAHNGSGYWTYKNKIQKEGGPHHGPSLCVIEAVLKAMHEESAGTKVGAHEGRANEGLHTGNDYVLQVRAADIA